MKNRIAALIITTIMALFVFGATFAVVVMLGFDIKPIEGSERTQGEATLIGSAILAVVFIGFFNGVKCLMNAFSWFVEEFDKRDHMDLG